MHQQNKLHMQQQKEMAFYSTEYYSTLSDLVKHSGQWSCKLWAT